MSSCFLAKLYQTPLTFSKTKPRHFFGLNLFKHHRYFVAKVKPATADGQCKECMTKRHYVTSLGWECVAWKLRWSWQASSVTEYRVWVLEHRVQQQYTAYLSILNRNFSAGLSSHNNIAFKKEAKGVQNLVNFWCWRTLLGLHNNAFAWN